jgi:peptidoglycan/LPS O-acetylase OafA/YrhL
LNRGVYPFYIIHQPLVYIGLFFLLREGYSDMTVFLLTTALVVLGCWIFFEAMKRNWVTRMMYGIKEHPKKIEQVQDDTENPPVV